MFEQRLKDYISGQSLNDFKCVLQKMCSERKQNEINDNFFSELQLLNVRSRLSVSQRSVSSESFHRIFTSARTSQKTSGNAGSEQQEKVKKKRIFGC